MTQSPSTSLQTLCEVVLGSHNDRVTLHHELAARATRFISATCMAVGAMAILASSARQSPPLVFSGVSLLYISQALSPVALAGLHLLYLWIVLRLLVFEIPSHRLKVRSILIPLILILSYVTYAAGPYKAEFGLALVNFKAVSSLLFVGVYLAWALRDYCESIVAEGSSSILRSFWMYADLGICIFLILDLYHWIPLPAYLSAKDLVVSACLGFYFVVHRTIVRTRQAEFTSVYSAYLDAVTAAHSAIRGDVEAVTDALAARLSSDELRILDFGSGDGRRLWWFLDSFGLLTPNGHSGHVQKLHVLMYDKRSRWQQLSWFCTKRGQVELERVRNANCEVIVQYTHAFRDVLGQANSFDLIHASHSVYDAKAFDEIRRILNKSRAGCVLALRGVGASIFRRMSEGLSLVAPTVRNVSYLWSFHFVDSVRRNELAYLVDDDASASCLVIDQQLEDETAISRVGDLLRTIYTGEWSERIDGLYQASLRHERLTGGVNNQDWLLFLRKP